MMIHFEELYRAMDELVETRLRAEKDYREMLKLYASEPVNTNTRKRAYEAIWLLAKILGYNEDTVEKDMQEAEKGE